MSAKNHARAIFAGMMIASNTAWGAETAVDIEYLPEGDYTSALGVGGYRLEDSGVGFYGNLQLTLTPREPHYDSLDMGSYGDPVTGRYKDILLANIGLTKKFTDSISGYAGIGYVSVTGVGEKYDPSHILASDGTYYVDDPENDESGMNLNTGVILGLEKFALNVGYHSFTNSLYFGAGMKF